MAGPVRKSPLLEPRGQTRDHVLTFGTHEDVKALRRHVSDEDLKEAIDKAPPGVFDARSWAYWNLIIGRAEAPPMPRRVFS